MRILFFILLLSGTNHAAAQQTSNWTTADQYILSKNYTVNSSEDLQLLLTDIQNAFTDTALKLRAIYAWVTANIAYDCGIYHNQKSFSSVDSVLKYKKATCAGYTVLFKYMCDDLNIPCTIIGGYGRSGIGDLLIDSDSLKVNHAWCAVMLNNKWQLIDVAWASGYTDENCKTFTRHRNDWYYLTPPEKFILDHFPRDTVWQLLPIAITAKQFAGHPLFYHGFTENNIQSFGPGNVYQSKNRGETIPFRFVSDKQLNVIIISSRTNKKIYKRDWLIKKGNEYSYNYKVEEPGKYDLQVDLLYMKPQYGYARQQYNSYIDLIYFIDAKNSRTKN